MRCWIKIFVVFFVIFLSGCDRPASQQVQWQDMHGKTVRLDDFKGQWVVVNYWATWCPPCRKEMPDLEAFYQHHQKTGIATVIGVNYEMTETKTILQFIKDYNINFPIVKSNDTNRSGQLPFGQLRGLPSTYIINPKGVVAHSKAGPLTEAWLHSKIP